MIRERCEKLFSPNESTVVYLNFDSEFEFYGIASGCSDEAARTGGGSTLAACCKALQEMDTEASIWRLTALLPTAISKALDQLVETSGWAREELATTLVAFYRSGDRVLTVHLGDGCVMGIQSEKDFGVMLSSGECVMGRVTYKTDTDVALFRHLRVQRQDVHSFRQLYIMDQSAAEHYKWARKRPEHGNIQCSGKVDVALMGEQGTVLVIDP